MTNMQFTNDWFESHTNSWNLLFNQYKPKKILEIGSFEGRSTCYMLQNIVDDLDSEIVCIDTWGGGEEHVHENMLSVEQRFDSNIEIARVGRATLIKKLKMESFEALSELVVNGYGNSFDLVYVDGSHQAPDVLSDLIFSYRLLKVGGILICDDYVWRHPDGIIHEPKLAIDSFSNIYRDKIAPFVDLPLRQIYFCKTS